MSVRLLTVLAVLAAINASAQEPPPTSRNVVTLLDVTRQAEMNQRVQAAQDVPKPPDPPASSDAWSLRVVTTGGFTGTGVGSVTLSSDGQMGCGPAPCATPIALALLKPVTTTIASIVEAAWVTRTPSGFCRDCVQTTMTLKRRDGDVIRTYVASWDDSQAATQELRELRRLALALRGSRAAR